MSGQTSGSSREKPGATLPKAVSDSIPYGQQAKLSLKEAFCGKPSKAAQGIWDQQSVESGPLKGMWPGNQKEPRPVTRRERSHPQHHQGGRTNLAKAKHSLGQPCLIHRISKAHFSKKRADKSDYERAQEEYSVRHHTLKKAPWAYDLSRHVASARGSVIKVQAKQTDYKGGHPSARDLASQRHKSLFTVFHKIVRENTRKAVPTCRLKGGPGGAFDLHEHMASTSGSFMTKTSQQPKYLRNPLGKRSTHCAAELYERPDLEVGVADGGMSHKTRLNYGMSLNITNTAGPTQRLQRRPGKAYYC
ncbi:hypothetical protein DPX16_6243 [Anabarilius grahami]|uniref:Uncharacterized protein n=1 Tax=Anabarilius grahami TaxID=495550 RepID=A0A3N0XCV0_ANAGA|nr:hypothetical protein DPX16_6243 [Anabarilius grahami]